MESWFLHHFAPCLSNDILLTTSYKTTIKPLHNENVSQSISLLASNRFLQVISLQITAEEKKPLLPIQDFPFLAPFIVL